MKPNFEFGGIGIYAKPNNDYLCWLGSSNSYFDGEDWGRVLEIGLNVKRFYLWDFDLKTGISLSVFKKGPFRMGYLGFPICVMHWQDKRRYSLNRMLEAISQMPGKPQLMRMAISPFSGLVSTRKKGKIATTTETCIVDLNDWSAFGTKKRKKDSRHANRHCSDLQLVRKASGSELYELYLRAIDRNSGAVRYSQQYFNELSDRLGGNKVKMFGLKDDRALLSMIITVRHADAVYYLHGGSVPEVMSRGASDFLMQMAIEDAQDTCANSFNFLSSPNDQAGLIKFKEKWGGISMPSESSTFSTCISGSFLLALI